MNQAIFRLERINFLFRGPALVVLSLIVLLAAYAGWSGDRWRDSRVQSNESFVTGHLQQLAEWREQLATIESGQPPATPYDANPMSITLPAVLPPSSLGDFTRGQSDLHPLTAEVSPWRNLSSVFGRYQFDNPTTLASSAFDLSLVIVLLMPLLMIVVSFDVVASERRNGSLAMILASSVRLSSLVWSRLAYRNGLLWLALALALLLIGLVNDSGGDRWSRLGLWLWISLMYAVVWLAVIACAVAYLRSAMATAGGLVGFWLLFTLALPATAATLAEVLYPAPSRLAFLSEIRQAEGETNRNLAELTEGFLMSHPELSVGDESLPGYFRAAFLSNQAARETTQPIVAEFKKSRQGREQTLGWLQFLSPAIMTERLLLQVAGADLARQFRFQDQVIASLDDLAAVVGPAAVSRNRISLASFDGLEPFEFKDITMRELVAATVLPSLWLLLISLVIGFTAHRRLSSDRLRE